MKINPEKQLHWEQVKLCAIRNLELFLAPTMIEPRKRSVCCLFKCIKCEGCWSTGMVWGEGHGVGEAKKSREQGYRVVLARMLVQTQADQRETKFLRVATRLAVVREKLAFIWWIWGDQEVRRWCQQRYAQAHQMTQRHRKMYITLRQDGGK